MQMIFGWWKRRRDEAEKRRQEEANEAEQQRQKEIEDSVAVGDARVAEKHGSPRWGIYCKINRKWVLIDESYTFTVAMLNARDIARIVNRVIGEAKPQ